MKYRLEELVDLQIGRTPPRKEFEWFNTNGEGYKWVSIKDMGNSGRFISDTSEYLTEAAQKRFGIPIVEKGTLLLSFKLTVGRLCITTDRMLTNEAIAQLPIKDTNIVDRDFLYYYLKNYNFHQLGSTSSIATAINSTYLKKMEIDLPPIDQQRAIAAVLSSIDDKIESNNAINNNLFKQAQSLYKANFIDFLPFNRVMPDDWRIGTVSEIILLHDSKRIPLSSRERANLSKLYPYYGATSVMDYVDRYLFDGVYLLLGEDGTVVDANGFPILQYVQGKFWVNNHAHIITGKNGFTVELLYLLFSMTKVDSIVTGAVQPKISQANLYKVEAVIPSVKVLQAFDTLIQPIFTEIRNITSENEKLTALRDTLLSKLLSGEIDVSGISVG